MKWVFEQTLEGAYVIRNPENDVCLDVSIGDQPSYPIGDPIVQWACHRKTTQHWDILHNPRDSSTFKLKSR